MATLQICLGSYCDFPTVFHQIIPLSQIVYLSQTLTKIPESLHYSTPSLALSSLSWFSYKEPPKTAFQSAVEVFFLLVVITSAASVFTLEPVVKVISWQLAKSSIIMCLTFLGISFLEIIFFNFISLNSQRIVMANCP